MLIRIQLFVTLWTIAHQVLLSMEFFRQEYWSAMPCPSPGDLPDPGMDPSLLCLLHCRSILYLLSCWGSPGKIMAGY